MFSSKLYSREKGKVNSTEHYTEQDLNQNSFVDNLSHPNP